LRGLLLCRQSARQAPKLFMFGKGCGVPRFDTFLKRDIGLELFHAFDSTLPTNGLTLEVLQGRWFGLRRCPISKAVYCIGHAAISASDSLGCGACSRNRNSIAW